MRPPRPLHPLTEWLERIFAHSLRLVLPRMTAPAWRSFCATKESLRGTRAHQRQRAGSSLHAVGSVDVVLDQDRNPVQRAARALGLPLLVEGVGNGQGVGVEFDHAVHRRPAPVDLFDPRHVFLGQGSRGKFPDFMPACKLRDGEFVEFEGSNLRSGWRDAPPARGHQPSPAASAARLRSKHSGLQESPAWRTGSAETRLLSLRKTGPLSIIGLRAGADYRRFGMAR